MHCRVGETLLDAVVGSSEAQVTYADIVSSSLKDTGGYLCSSCLVSDRRAGKSQARPAQLETAEAASTDTSLGLHPPLPSLPAVADKLPVHELITTLDPLLTPFITPFVGERETIHRGSAAACPPACLPVACPRIHAATPARPLTLPAALLPHVQ